MDRSRASTTSASPLRVSRAGRVVAWGDNSYERVIPADLEIRKEITAGVSSVAVGVNHSMVVKSGRVMVWGQSEYGQTAVPENAQVGVDSIAAGNFHCLALKEDRAIGWGWSQVVPSEVPVPAQYDVVAVAGGYSHSLALRADGKVVCWGAHKEVHSDVLAGVTAIAAGHLRGVALKDDSVTTWNVRTGEPVIVPDSVESGVVAISAFGEYALALLENETVVAWNITLGKRELDVPPDAASDVASVHCGISIGLVIKTDGSTVMWQLKDATIVEPIGEAISGLSAADLGDRHFLTLKPKPRGSIPPY